MKNKWSIAALAVLLVVVAGALWMSARQQKAIIVEGNLSPQEVGEIKAAVKKDMRRRIFPGFSVASIKRLPANIKWYFRLEVRSIHLVMPGRAFVSVTKPNNPDTFTHEVYEAIKGTNGWTAHRLQTELNDIILMDNQIQRAR